MQRDTGKNQQIGDSHVKKGRTAFDSLFGYVGFYVRNRKTRKNREKRLLTEVSYRCKIELVLQM